MKRISFSFDIASPARKQNPAYSIWSLGNGLRHMIIDANKKPVAGHSYTSLAAAQAALNSLTGGSAETIPVPARATAPAAVQRRSTSTPAPAPARAAGRARMAVQAPERGPPGLPVPPLAGFKYVSSASDQKETDYEILRVETTVDRITSADMPTPYFLIEAYLSKFEVDDTGYSYYILTNIEKQLLAAASQDEVRERALSNPEWRAKSPYGMDTKKSELNYDQRERVNIYWNVRSAEQFLIDVHNGVKFTPVNFEAMQSMINLAIDGEEDAPYFSRERHNPAYSIWSLSNGLRHMIVDSNKKPVAGHSYSSLAAAQEALNTLTSGNQSLQGVYMPARATASANTRAAPATAVQVRPPAPRGVTAPAAVRTPTPASPPSPTGGGWIVIFDDAKFHSPVMTRAEADASASEIRRKLSWGWDPYTLMNSGMYPAMAQAQWERLYKKEQEEAKIEVVPYAEGTKRKLNEFYHYQLPGSSATYEFPKGDLGALADVAYALSKALNSQRRSWYDSDKDQQVCVANDRGNEDYMWCSYAVGLNPNTRKDNALEYAEQDKNKWAEEVEAAVAPYRKYIQKIKISHSEPEDRRYGGQYRYRVYTLIVMNKYA